MAITPNSGASIVLMTASGDTLGNQVDCKALWWQGKGLTIGDDIVVKNAASDETYFQAAASDSNMNLAFPIDNILEGLKITTLDGGNLFVIRNPTRSRREHTI